MQFQIGRNPFTPAIKFTTNSICSVLNYFPFFNAKSNDSSNTLSNSQNTRPNALEHNTAKPQKTILIKYLASQNKHKELRSLQQAATKPKDTNTLSEELNSAKEDIKRITDKFHKTDYPKHILANKLINNLAKSIQSEIVCNFNTENMSNTLNCSRQLLKLEYNIKEVKDLIINLARLAYPTPNNIKNTSITRKIFFIFYGTTPEINRFLNRNSYAIAHLLSEESLIDNSGANSIYIKDKINDKIERLETTLKKAFSSSKLNP